MSAEQRGLKCWWEKEKEVRENQSVRGNGIHLKKRETVRVDFFQNGLGLGLLGSHPFCNRLFQVWRSLEGLETTWVRLKGLSTF